MKYHNNEVTLRLSDGYELVSGSYTVDSLSITKGQDPDNFNKPGMVKTIEPNGKLSFRVGRKGSEQVATWFNDRIPPSQTTFNHKAGKLNFAFIGTLVLTVKGGILGGRQDTFTFKKVALAQGHSGVANNWWFGGQNCSHIQNNQVICRGVNSAGKEVLFVFLRGGNAASTVQVTPTTLVDTANWMAAVPDDTTLNKLMMPGSHDAGMSELHHCNPPVLADPYTQTQSGNIAQQLIDGSRYFDIRVDYDHDKLVTYHRSGKFGCNGQDLKDVLNQVKTFLTAHKSETAILKFSHIRGDSGHDPARTKRLTNELLNGYQSVMYAAFDSKTNIVTVRLTDVRGKMIVAYDYDEDVDTADGRFRYKDGHAAADGANLTVYDRYSNTANYDDMAKDQIQKWHRYAKIGGDYLFLLSWTLTSTEGPLTGSIKSLAKTANANLPTVLHEQIVNQKTARPNIVYVDYVNNLTTQSIILYNLPLDRV